MQTKFFKAFEGVINTLNDSAKTKIWLSQAHKAIGGNKTLAITGTAGLGLWLYSRSLGSKRFKQGDD